MLSVSAPRELDKQHPIVYAYCLIVIIGTLLLLEQYFLGLFTAVFSCSLFLYLHWQIEFDKLTEETSQRKKRIYPSEELSQFSIMSFLSKRFFGELKSKNEVKKIQNTPRIQSQDLNNSCSSTSDVFSNVSTDQELPRFSSPKISRRQSFRTSINSPLGNISKSSSSSSKVSRRASFTYGFNSGLSSIGSPPVSPLSRPALPRVQRMTESDSSSFLLSPKRATMSPNKYPTHQSKYSGAGILPSVKLHRQERHVLSDLNRPVISRPVTVKIAPPDVLKPPTPLVLPLEDKIDNGKKSDDSDAVLTALREKRKRPQVDDPVQTPSEQMNKRRRQVSKSPTRETSTSRTSPQKEGANILDSTKRTATKRPVSNGHDESAEEKGTNSKRTKMHYTVSALEASYASSRGWLQRQQSDKQSESVDSPLKDPVTRRVTRSKSRERSVARSTPRSEIISGNLENHRNEQKRETSRPLPRLDLDDDVVMSPSGSTLANKGPDTPLIDNSLTESELKKELGKKKPQVFALKKGTTKLRSTPIYSGSPSTNENIPTLRYSHTAEDYEKDRQEDINRIQQMLDDVDEAHKAKLDKTKEKSQNGTTSFTSSTLTLTTPVTSISNTTVSGTAPTGIITASVGSTLGSSTAPATDVSSKPTLSLGSLGTGIGTTTTTSTAAKGFTLGTMSVANSGQGTVSLFGASTNTSSATTTLASSSALTSKAPPPPYSAPSSTAIPPTVTSSALSGNTDSSKALSTLNAASGLSVLGQVSSSTNPTATQEKATPQFTPAFQSIGANPQTSTASFTSSAPKSNNPPVSKTIGGFSFATKESVGQGLNVQSNQGNAPTVVPSSTALSNSSNPPAFPFGAPSGSSSSNKASFSFGKQPEVKAAPTQGFSLGTKPTENSPAPITFGQDTTKSQTVSIGFSQQSTAPSNPASGTFTFGQSGNAGKAPGFGESSGNTSSGFSFGQKQAANLFGQVPSQSSTSAPGQSAIANMSSPFGKSTMTSSTPASAGFTFGQTSTPTGQSQNTNTSAQFGFGSSTSTSTQKGFGQSTAGNSTQSNPTVNSPSIFGQTTNSAFGQGTQNTSSSITFGKVGSTKTTTAPSIFGQSTSDTKMSTSQTPIQTGGSSVFQFGQSSAKPEQPKNNSTFSFGQGSNTASKTPSSGVFGATSNPSSSGGMFGGTTKTPSSSGIFGATGSSQPSNIFGATQTPQKSGTGTSNTSGFNTNQNQASSFGSNSQPAFGAGGGFGNTASQSQQSKGFDFSSSAGGNSGFSFGNTPAKPQSQGFSFTAGQNSQPTPAFGTPGVSAPGGFGTPAPSGQPAMFSVGSGSTAPKPRSRSRRPPRR